jgi:hypothetical protein
LDKRLDCPQNWFGCLGKQKKKPCPARNQNPDRPARSLLVTILTTLSGSTVTTRIKKTLKVTMTTTTTTIIIIIIIIISHSVPVFQHEIIFSFYSHRVQKMAVIINSA